MRTAACHPAQADHFPRCAGRRRRLPNAHRPPPRVASPYYGV